MAIRKFRTGQMSYAVDTYVGTAGTLFYDEDNGALRISDGVTPGGSLISYPVASSTEIGGIKLGPGVVLNNEDQIIIDSEGLDFSFGDLASTTETYPVGHPKAGDDYAVLSTINANEDLYLVSNGLGSIDVIGEFKVYKTDGDVEGAISVPPIFTVKGDGQIRMLVPGADSAEGALSIIGGLDGVFQAPVNTGVMLHITGIAGSPGVPSRVYNDAQNAFAAFVARRYNNTAASPSAVLANEEIMRLSGTAHNGTDIPGTANQRIVYVARGNQTTSNQGGAIELWATPLNSTTLAKVATVDSTGIALESGKVLTGNVTGNVSGSAATLTTARNINGVSFNGSADITVTANTTNALTIGTGLSGTSFNGSSAVTIALATGYGDTQNPYASKTANNFLAAPNGSNGAPTFRAIVAADIPTLNQNTTGSAATLTTARNINGVSFNGSADITVTAAAGTLTGTTLNATVVTSSLTSVGTLTTLSVSNDISDGIGNVRSVPLNAQGGAYNLAATDNGKMINITTGGVSVLQNVFGSPFGQIISIYNNSNASQTITQGANVTLRLAGTAATGNRTLARYGVATLTCVASNTFVISGAGLT